MAMNRTTSPNMSKGGEQMRAHSLVGVWPTSMAGGCLDQMGANGVKAGKEQVKKAAAAPSDVAVEMKSASGGAAAAPPPPSPPSEESAGSQALSVSSDLDQLVTALSGSDAQKTEAAKILCGMSDNWPEVQIKIGEKAVAPLVALLSGTEEQKEHASGALRHLFMEERNVCYQPSLKDAIVPCVAMLKSGTDTQKSNACAMLNRISIIVDHRYAISEAGGLEALVALGKGGEAELARCANKTLDMYVNLPLQKKIAALQGGGEYDA